MSSDNTTPQALADELCKLLKELTRDHHAFYECAEYYFGDSAQPPINRGLSLFPSWLRERELTALEIAEQIQSSLSQLTPAS